MDHLHIELKNDVGMVELEEQLPPVSDLDGEITRMLDQGALQGNIVQHDLYGSGTGIHDTLFDAFHAAETSLR